MHVDRSLPSVAQRANFSAYARPNILQKADLRAIARPTSPKAESVDDANESLAEKNLPRPTPGVGLLVMNSSLFPMSFNPEAVQILSYPTHQNIPRDGRRVDVFLAGRIRSALVSHEASGEFAFVNEFSSGRRRYHCRAFFLDYHSKGPSHPSLALLLERGPSGLVQVSQVSEQFNLTCREREALGFLFQGLTSKEIANRMKISPNTVKAFLRLIMIKMGVSTRCAVVGKMMAARP